MEIRTVRLGKGDGQRARELFALLATVFEEEVRPLCDSYVDELLARADFLAVAAFADGELAGGITAHVLPMTNREGAELFIYDVAVAPAYQRRGVGRLLVSAVRKEALAAGIDVVFVLADNNDTHAISFYESLGSTPSAVTLFTFGRDA